MKVALANGATIWQPKQRLEKDMCLLPFAMMLRLADNL